MWTIRLTPTAEGRVSWKVLVDNVRKRVIQNANKFQAILVFAGMLLPGSDPRDLYKALQTLQDLRVSIVVRLCSSYPRAIDFYNSLDRSLNVTVIGDFLEHAAKAHQTNPWLNYAIPLHRSRELGYNPRVFSLLDQRALDKDELRVLLVMLFGKRAMIYAPDIYTEFGSFFLFLVALIESRKALESSNWKNGALD